MTRMADPKPGTRVRRGFTLIELIVIILVGAVISSLLITIAQQTMPHFGEETVIQVERQYDMLREVEMLQSAYREEIEDGTLSLATLLNTWVPASNTVTKTVTTATVSDAGGSFTFSTPIYKVRFSSGDYSMYAYFAQ